MIIAYSFNLVLSIPINPCPTRYSDIAEEANSVINLMFLWYGSTEINQHSIHPNCYLFLDHALLSITISIVDELINTSDLLIQQNSKQEIAFVEECNNLKLELRLQLRQRLEKE